MIVIHMDKTVGRLWVHNKKIAFGIPIPWKKTRYMRRPYFRFKRIA